jgi:hypothetical protein
MAEEERRSPDRLSCGRPRPHSSPEPLPNHAVAVLVVNVRIALLQQLSRRDFEGDSQIRLNSATDYEARIGKTRGSGSGNATCRTGKSSGFVG